MHTKEHTPLAPVIAGIQRRWGAKALRKLRELPPITATAPISTGFFELDQVLAIGGVPRGHLTTLAGFPTSGVTTLALKIAAQAQQTGDMTAYIDLNRSLDLDYAARCGITLDNLLLIHPPAKSQAPGLVRDLVHSRVVGVVVLNSVPDLVDDPVIIREFLTVLRQLTGSRAGSTCAVLLLVTACCQDNAYQTAIALLEGQDALRLHLDRQQWLTDSQDVQGYLSRVTVLKNRFAPADRSVMVTVNLRGITRGEGE